MCCQKSSPAGAHEGSCSLCRVVARLPRAPCLPGNEPASFDPAQAAHTGSPHRGPAPHARDRRDANPVRLSSCACDAQARGMAGWEECRLPAVSRRRSGFTDKTGLSGFPCAGDPNAWRAITEAAYMQHDNREAIAKCKQGVVKTTQPIRCTITARQ